MKISIFLLSVSLCPLVFSGCGESQAHTPISLSAAAAATYKAGHGIQLSPTAAQFIGLQTAEVAAHRFSSGDEASAIPVDALLRTIKGDFVYVANGESFLRTAVTLGATDATHVEIKDGLYDGDSIVVKGVRALSLTEIQALNGGVGCADGH